MNDMYQERIEWRVAVYLKGFKLLRFIFLLNLPRIGAVYIKEIKKNGRNNLLRFNGREEEGGVIVE